MNEEFNLKYTVLSCYPGSVLTHDIEDELPMGYIASPCYLINKKEVVIPFDYESKQLVNIVIDNEGKCINSSKTELLFDTLFEARKYADYLNNVLRARIEIYAYKNYYGKSYGYYAIKINELKNQYMRNMGMCSDIQREVLNTCKSITDSKSMELRKE